MLISTHICHPSLGNDNLSGVAVATFLARRSGAAPALLLSVRVHARDDRRDHVAAREPGAVRIRHGLVLTCVGRRGTVTYKRSRRGNAEIDRAVAHVLATPASRTSCSTSPDGYDERQYCSPGFDLPVGCFMRTPRAVPRVPHLGGQPRVRSPGGLADSFRKVLAALSVLEGNATYVNLNPKCEPQLGRRGLHGPSAAARTRALDELALLWVLNLSDGRHSLLDIAERSGLGSRRSGRRPTRCSSTNC